MFLLVGFGKLQVKSSAVVTLQKKKWALRRMFYSSTLLSFVTLNMCCIYSASVFKEKEPTPVAPSLHKFFF